MSTVILQTPYYTVSTSNEHAALIELTQDATDAIPDKRPSKIEGTAQDGVVDYYEDAPEKTDRDWRKKLGKLLTAHVVKPELQDRGMKFKGRIDSASLLLFPSGYKLYTHKKGDKHIPRRDSYLMGSEHVVKFRSPNEFFLHAKWLMEGKPLKPDRKPACECRYCDSSVTQSDISKRYNLGHVAEKHKKGVRNPRTTRVSPVPFKDYTKLNQNASSSAT